MSNNEFTYIYILIDPIINEVKYVGKSDNPHQRLNEHLKKAKYSHTHKNHWILSLAKKGLIPLMIIIDEVLTNEFGFWEQFWIDYFKSYGFNLTNIASGGVGGNLGVKVNRLISEKLKGRKFTNDTILKMKNSAKNRKLSDEGRKSLSKHRSGLGNPMYGKHRPESSKKFRKIQQLDKNNNIIAYWDGITIASNKLKINRCTISDVCNGRKKSAGGFIWKYV